MQMNRRVVALKKLTDPDDNYVKATPSERVSYIWELTAELWSLTGKGNAEQRLQRDVVALNRSQG
ncbi:MAG: hypothetical protein NPIRA02_23780 [Nitrospirales bacterium]|nr:MAG: hypothetical protein NPIRA02_23780 [Nitrospirales bacterium]